MSQTVLPGPLLPSTPVLVLTTSWRWQHARTMARSLIYRDVLAQPLPAKCSDKKLSQIGL